MHCWGSQKGNPRESPQCQWVEYWVQLPNAHAAAAYRRYLFNYAEQYKAPGRFDGSGTKTRLFPMMPWLAHLDLVPSNLRLQIWLAQGFLLVCMLNVVGLLLAKFLRAGVEVGIRRAVGATRREIFAQFVVEGVFIGLLGGVLGAVFALVGLWFVRSRPSGYAHMAHMDLTILAATISLALLAAFLAALLPAWRVCRVSPALAVKVS
jgi:putative ABC transport system permease protein